MGCAFLVCVKALRCECMCVVPSFSSGPLRRSLRSTQKEGEDGTGTINKINQASNQAIKQSINPPNVCFIVEAKHTTETRPPHLLPCRTPSLLLHGCCCTRRVAAATAHCETHRSFSRSGTAFKGVGWSVSFDDGLASAGWSGVLMGMGLQGPPPIIVLRSTRRGAGRKETGVGKLEMAGHVLPR